MIALLKEKIEVLFLSSSESECVVSVSESRKILRAKFQHTRRSMSSRLRSATKFVRTFYLSHWRNGLKIKSLQKDVARERNPKYVPTYQRSLVVTYPRNWKKSVLISTHHVVTHRDNLRRKVLDEIDACNSDWWNLLMVFKRKCNHACMLDIESIFCPPDVAFLSSDVPQPRWQFAPVELI